MKNLNREKQLIKLNEVPKHFSIDEIAYEIKKIMNYDRNESKDIAGIFLEESGIENPFVEFYIFFLSKNSINKIIELCHVINGKKVIYMFNHPIEIQFKPDEIWTLMTAEHINNQVSDKEIVIKHVSFNNITTMLHTLPEHTRCANKHHQIYSIIQSTNTIFIRFNSNDNAKRAKTMLEREGMQIEWSKTYVCLCKEIIDDNPVPNSLSRKSNIDDSKRRKIQVTRNEITSINLKRKGKNNINTVINEVPSPQITSKDDDLKIKCHIPQNPTKNNGNKITFTKIQETERKNEDVLIIDDRIEFSDDE